MLIKFKSIGLSIIILCLVLSCNRGPKVISSSTDAKSSEKNSMIFSNDSSTLPKINQSFSEDLHTVVVTEVLPASRYVYLNVKENGEQFWIATRKNEINVGGTYYYKGGLLKTNFESKEHNRMFEKIYLVTNLVQVNHANNTNTIDSSKKLQQSNSNNNDKPGKSQIIGKTGSIKISELINNHKKYEGKMIQLSGKCVKINPNIMGRNWIHLKDGSKDDYDLVITSDTFVPEGTVITIKAVVTLNKDFGAGYKYDLILEDGVIVK